MPAPLIARLISPFINATEMRDFGCWQLKDASDRAPKTVPNVFWWIVHDGHVNGLQGSPQSLRTNQAHVPVVLAFAVIEMPLVLAADDH
jgi:hypothetical protein